MCSPDSLVFPPCPYSFHPSYFLLLLSQRQPSRSRGAVPRPLPYDEQQPLSSAGDSIPVGSLFEASHGPPGSAFLVRLPGRDLNQETLRVGLVRIDGHTEGANLSVIGSHFSRPRAPDSLPSWATVGIHRLLDYPPECGRSFSSPSPAALLSVSCLSTRFLGTPTKLFPHLLDLRAALGTVVLVPTPSLSSVLRPHPSDSSPLARRSLLSSHREIRLMTQWGVPHLPSPAMIIFGHLERKVRVWLHQQFPQLTPAAFCRRLGLCIPPLRIILSCIIGPKDLCPTLSSQRSGLPIRLCDFTFLTLRHLWALFGLPVPDPLFRVLRVLSAPTWHHMLCSGVSNHVMTQVLTFIRSNPASPLCGLPSWRIVTAFSGPETFLACIRSLSPPLPYTLVASSDVDPACRAVIRAVHSRLQPEPPIVFESAQSVGARHAPSCHLTCWGYPCVIFSDLNRFVTDDDLAGSIALFDVAFDHLLLRRPPVFIFENVASLLSTRLVWVVDHFLFKINSLGGYRIYLNILCPSYFGARMTRPRLIIVAMLSPGAFPPSLSFASSLPFFSSLLLYSLSSSFVMCIVVLCVVSYVAVHVCGGGAGWEWSEDGMG